MSLPLKGNHVYCVVHRMHAVSTVWLLVELQWIIIVGISGWAACQRCRPLVEGQHRVCLYRMTLLDAATLFLTMYV